MTGIMFLSSGNSNLGRLALEYALFAISGPGRSDLGVVSHCFSIAKSNAGVRRASALFVIVDRFVG
jgi:hypothetical protein